MTRTLILSILLATLGFSATAHAKGVISEHTDALRKRKRSTIYHQALKQAVYSVMPRVNEEHRSNAYRFAGLLDQIRTSSPEADGLVIARAMVEKLGPAEAVKLSHGVATAASDSTKFVAKTAATHLKLVRQVVAEQRAR